jgi:NAD+ kinase
LKLAFLPGEREEAQWAADRLRERYGDVSREDADVLVPLGGDGTMLKTLHSAFGLGKPIYGMNRGSVGFLMNVFDEHDLLSRIRRAEPSGIVPLRMHARRADGSSVEALAFNEVALLRETRQTAKLRISVDGKIRLPELMCDGALVCTSAGSTAYNLSAHGPILPLRSRLLALTPISAFRPRRWRGAVLPHTCSVDLEVLEAVHRPVGASADMTEVRDIAGVYVEEATSAEATLLFDPDHTLEERILSEQFAI